MKHPNNYPFVCTWLKKYLLQKRKIKIALAMQSLQQKQFWH